MEKITLKPIARELLFKADEPDTHCDVASFSGTNNQEKGLGSLYLISHIKYEHEDLGYVVSLLSSLARREYYSQTALKSQDPKQAFEGTLQKLNEVLKDFFDSKQFLLNIGLAAIAGEKIFISKLGKFKVALARNNEYIDVLNNLALFHKSEENVQQFSNVISGTLQPGDKLFAYYPARSLTSRERVLQTSLVRDDQSVFSQKMGELAETATNFNCCGVHINLDQIREIPLESVPTPLPVANYATAPRLAPEPLARAAQTDIDKFSPQSMSATPPPMPSPNLSEKFQGGTDPEGKTKVIAAELERGNRANALTSFGRGFANLADFGRLAPRLRTRNFIIVAAIIIVPLIGVVWFRSGDGGAVKAAYKNATQALAQAQSKLAQNDERSARILLQSTLAQLSAFSSRDIEVIKGQLVATLDEVDHISPVTPVLVHQFAPTSDSSKIVKITESGKGITGISTSGIAVQIAGDAETTLGTLNGTPAYAFGGPTSVVIFDGTDTVSVYSAKVKSIDTYKLKGAKQATSATLYEGNLYTLSEASIYKYSDAVLGDSPRIEWSKEALADAPIQIAVDGDVLILTSEGKLVDYYGGKKKQEFDLGITPIASGQLLTTKDNKNIYVTDPDTHRIYAFEKERGSLIATYKIDAVGVVSDVALGTGGSLLILSGDGKIWQITP